MSRSFRRVLALAGVSLATLLLAGSAQAQFTVTATSGPAPAPEAHIRVSWTSTETPGELYVIRRTLLVFNQPPVDEGVVAVRPETELTFLDTNTRPGTTYEYCVTPQTSGTPEACASGYRDLRRPQNLTATDSTRTDGVALTWVDASSVEVGYVVFRDAPGTPTNDPAALTPIDTTTADATGALDATGVPGQRYQYCVGLLDGFGGVQTVVPPLACDIGTRGVVAPPSGVAASDGTLDDRVRVVWTTRPNITYTVYRESETEPRAALAPGLTASPYEDLTAVALTPYTYCVTATNAQGESVPVCDAGQRGGLARPDTLYVSDGTSDSAVELSWLDPGPTETGFRLYRQQCLPAGGPEEFVAEVPANRTRYSDTGAVPGRCYDFSIEAIATVTVDSVSVTTASQRRGGQNVGRRAILLPPTDFTATDAGDGDESYVEVTWETESDVVQLFQVFREGTPLATLAPFARSYRDATGLSGTTYDYLVRAVAVVDLDPALVKQGLAPIFARAAAQREALAADRKDAPDADARARLDARAETAEAALVRDIQELLAGMGADARGLTDPDNLTADLVTRDSDPDEGTRLLRAPDGLAATTELEDRIRITWADRSSIETDYEIRAHYSPTDSVDVLVGPNRTEWVDISAPAGNDVRYQIRTLDGDPVDESASEWVEVTGRRDLLPPGRVRAAQQLVETELVVTWRDSSRAETGYVVTTQLAAGIFSQTTEANARQIRIPIQPEDFGQPTNINIIAVDSTTARVGAPSQSAAVAVTVTPTLLAPSVVTASTEYPNQVVVSWTDESAANDGYRVVRGGAVPDTLAATGTTAIDASPAGPAPYCVIPTRTGLSAAEPEAVCATGRVSSSTAPSTGDVVSTFSRIGALDIRGANEGFGETLATSQNGLLSVGAGGHNRLIDYRYTPEWSLPLNSIWPQLGVGSRYPYGIYNIPPNTSYSVGSDNVGVAAFYERSAEGNWSVRSTEQLSPSSSFTYRRFGADMDIEGDLAIIGAPGAASFSDSPPYIYPDPQNREQYVRTLTYGDGGSYLYRRNAQGGWDRVTVLRALGYVPNLYTDTNEGDNTIPTETVQGLQSAYVVRFATVNCPEYGQGFRCLEVRENGSPGVAPLEVQRMGELVALTPTWAFSAFEYLADPAGPRDVIGMHRTSGSYDWAGFFNGPEGFDLDTGSLAADGDLLAIGSGVAHVNLQLLDSNGLAGQFPLASSVGASAEYGAAVDVDTDGALTVDGDLAVVGAPGSGDNAVYVYRRQSGFSWAEEARLTPEEGDTRFGTSVTIADGFIAIGAEQAGTPGVVYTFRKEGLDWVQASRLTPAEAPGVGAGAQFGTDVAAFEDDLVIGAPGTVSDGIRRGSVYFATVSVSPTDVRASDGRYANRILVRWEDQAEEENGYRVYRRGPTDEVFQLVGTLSPNTEVFDDFDVSPGDAYQYCIASFLDEDVSNTNPLGESGRSCDAGYTPPNGTISGRLATAEGAPVIGTGVCLAPGLDQAIMFDGLGGRGAVSSFGSLPAAFTMEAWIHADAYDEGANPVAGVDGASYAMLEVVGASGAGSPRLRVQNDGDPAATVIDAPALAPGWHHLAATHDGSTLAFYVDGQPAGTAAFAGTTLARGTFQIASDLAGNTFDGRLDDIRLWSRALTPAQIASSYEEARPLEGDESDLYAYWAIDQGIGRILTDLTEGGRHATLQGGAEWTREGAPLNTCADSDGDGNYTFAGLRYGDRTAFRVTPTDSTRQFTPGTRTATLTPESPTENQMDFTDTSAYTVRGTVLHAVNPDGWDAGSASLPAALPAPEVEILVDGVVAGTSESDGTFAVAVRGVGAHVLEAQGEDFVFTAALGAQTFDDGLAAISLTGDLEGLTFTNTTQRELRGQAAGGCERPIGDLTFRVYTEDRLFDATFTTDESVPYARLLPPLEYRLEYTGIGPVPGPLDRTAVVDYFRNLGVLSADLTLEADTVDFRYRAPIVLAIEGLTPPAPACVSAGGYTVVDADGNPRQSLPAVPVIAEYARTPLTIRAFEDYGDGGLCPVDAGTVRIFDGFADAAAEPVEVALENGEAEYTTFGRSPDTFSGRTVAGVDRSYQKSLSAVLEVPDGPSVTETVWAVVEGYREKPATFVTATMSEIPVMILRDPPGTESSAFVEEESQSCVGLSEVNFTSAAGGGGTDLRLGFKPSIGFGVEVELGGGFLFQANTILGGSVSQTTGAPESNMQVCATTTERWETRGDTGWSGEDLYAGVGANVIFAEADVVGVEACNVALSTTLATDFDSIDPFETTFVYGKTHIQETLIPRLETLARLAGDEVVIEEESGEAPLSVTIRKAIENWEGMTLYNDSLVTEALAGEVENRSFSGGTTYSFGTAADTTLTSSYASRVFFTSDMRLGAVITLGGFDNLVYGIAQVGTETTFARENTTSTSYGTGYTLSDSDAGDYFSVDVARDPRYGTYVFNTLSGASSNPWEPNTQKRDLPQLAIDPPVRGGIPDGEAALYTLQLTNASESNERREYVLDVPPHLNASGAVVKLNGAVLSEKRVLIDANQTISFPITVERGPEADTSDVAIIAYSPFDHAIWRTAPQLGLVTADTARFQVSFIPSVAPVRLVEPLDGWAVTLDSASVQLSIGDLVLQGIPSETVGVQFRRGQEAWDTVFSQTGDQVTGTSIPFVWTPPNVPPAPLPDGPYELRAFALRGGPTAAPPYYGPAVPGVIDRTAPRVFGLPEPADGVLALGETVEMTFEEPIDCVRLRRDLLTDPTLIQLGSVATAIGCVDRSLLIMPQNESAWLAFEGQRVTAHVEDVRDLAGNEMDAPMEWSFTVRRNAFGWTPAVVAVNAQPGVPMDLPAALVNGRAQPVDYDLVPQNATGLPFTFTETTSGAEIRVTTTPLEGTVVSGDVQPVAFRWPGAPVGTYTSTIEVHSVEDGQDITSPLEMTVDVSCRAPQWAVNPAAFEESMTVTAQLLFNGTASSDPADSLAAFVDGEVRGVGAVQDMGGNWRVPLTIYGTGAADRIVFQAWDSDLCTRHTTTSAVLEFSAGTTIYTSESPLVVDAPGAGGDPLEVPLAAGWTWVSTNRSGTETLGTALVGVGSSSDDVIQSQDAFSQYVPSGPETGWFGSVAGMTPGEGYKLRLALPATLTHPGAPVDPATPIALDAGWNWIGFLPQAPLPLADALASVTFEAGDAIKSQEFYAQYTATGVWEGSLTEMQAGLGYQLYLQDDAVLTYPSSTPLAKGDTDDPWAARPVRRMDTLPIYAMRRAFQVPVAVGETSRLGTGTGRAETLRHRGTVSGKGGSPLVAGYEHSMTLTATLETSRDDLWIAAFAPDGDGETLRGLTPLQMVTALGGSRAYLLIGGVEASETVTLRAGTMSGGAFVPMEGEVMFPAGLPDGSTSDPVRASFAYERDAAWGTPDAPVAISMASATAGEETAVPAVVELAPTRPNPFATTAVFEFALPAPEAVHLAIYDMLGREVAVLADGPHAAGRHEVRFDGRALASGTYVARLMAGADVRARTFIVSR